MGLLVAMLRDMIEIFMIFMILISSTMSDYPSGVSNSSEKEEEGGSLLGSYVSRVASKAQSPPPINIIVHHHHDKNYQ